MLEVRRQWTLLRAGQAAPDQTSKWYFMPIAESGGYSLLKITHLQRFNPIRHGRTRRISALNTQRCWLTLAIGHRRRWLRCPRKETAWLPSRLRRVRQLTP